MAQYPQEYVGPSGRVYIITGRNPGMYPMPPGPNYRGEVQGMVYDYTVDKYVPDPKAQEEFLINQGIKERPKKPPSPWETIGYSTAGATAATVLGHLAMRGIDAALAPAVSEAGGTAATTTTGATAGGGGLLAGGGGAAAGGAGGTAGAGTAGATGTASAAGATAAESGLLGPAAAITGAIIVGNNLYEDVKPIAEGRGKTKDWVDVGLDLGAIPLLPGTNWINPTLKTLGLPSVGNMLGLSKKNKGRQYRDAYRKVLEESGVAIYQDNENGKKTHQLILADGSGYDIGSDGSFRRTSKEGKEYASYEVDPDNPFGAQAVGWGNALVSAMTPDAKNKEQLVAWFSNAAMSNAESMEDVRANFLNFAKQLELDPTTMIQNLDKALEAGVITQEDHDAFVYGVHTMTNGNEELYQYGSVSEIEKAKEEDKEVAEEGGEPAPGEGPGMGTGGTAPVEKPVAGQGYTPSPNAGYVPTAKQPAGYTPYMQTYQPQPNATSINAQQTYQPLPNATPIGTPIPQDQRVPFTQMQVNAPGLTLPSDEAAREAAMQLAKQTSIVTGQRVQGTSGGGLLGGEQPATFRNYPTQQIAQNTTWDIGNAQPADRSAEIEGIRQAFQSLGLKEDTVSTLR